MLPMMAAKASAEPSEPYPLRGLRLLLVSSQGLRLRLLLRPAAAAYLAVTHVPKM